MHTADRADPWRWIARVLCVLFGLIGTLPFAAELLLRLAPLEEYANRESARILREQLGLEASYRIRVHLIPLAFTLEDLVVPASDGQKTPALTVERLRIRPRIFGLLGGRLDVGDVEIEAPRARLVLRDGKLANVRYQLPPASKPSRPVVDSPFNTLSISDARLLLDVDGTLIDSGNMDLDVFGAKGPTFEIMLSTSGGSVTRTRKLPSAEGDPNPELVHEEDVLCRMELRAQLEAKSVLVRRLSAAAVVDPDPAPGSAPSCEVGEDAVGRTLLRLSQARLLLRDEDTPLVSGQVAVRGPLALITRFIGGPKLQGWAGFQGNLRYTGEYTLPALDGRLTGAGIGIEDFRIASTLGADVQIKADVIQIPKLELVFSDGHVVIEGNRIAPLQKGVPMSVERFEAKGVIFETMMRDLNVTPNTIVRWNLAATRVHKLKGTLVPLVLDGDLAAENRDFEVFDRAFHDPKRRHMIGVKNAALRGKVGIRQNALQFYDTRADFGSSSMNVKMVSIGFDNRIKIQIAPGSKLNLADISPLVDIPMAGIAELSVDMGGAMDDPLLKGELKVQGFEFGGFPLGDIQRGKVTFRPLWLEFNDVEAKKGSSEYRIPKGRIDFETRASILVDAEAESESFDLEDFFAMWHFDEDPRFAAMRGSTAVEARIRYVLGGREDRCGGGILQTSGKLRAHELNVYEERYDGGSASFDFVWNDRDATYRGVRADIPDFVLKKGTGTISGKIQMTPGARVTGEVTAHAVPIGKIDNLPNLLKAAEGTVSASGFVSGSIDALAMELSANVTSLRAGASFLPGSNFHVLLVPETEPEPILRTTRCGQPVSPPFDREDYERDRPLGVFHVDGSLLGAQIALTDVRVTRQRKKTLAGKIALGNLDLGALSELIPALAVKKPRPNGRVSGAIDLEHLELDHPSEARGSLDLASFTLENAGFRADLVSRSGPVRFDRQQISIPSTTIALTSPRGQSATIDLAGSVDPQGALDATLLLRPVPLAGLVGVIPRVERAAGSLSGQIRLLGSLGAPRASGGIALQRGELSLRGLPSSFSDIDLAVGIDGDELSITKGSMRFGNGTIALSGGVPLHGLTFGETRVRIAARDVSLPLKDGVRAVGDAELLATYRPSSETDSGRQLPRITGNVLLRSAEYRRAVAMAADLNSLAQRGKRTVIDSYDPSEDTLEFDVNIKAQRALKLHNDLVEADLLLDDDGVQFSGTNARQGLRGLVHVKPGGRITLRRSEFEIDQGTIRFDDLTRIAPKVDVSATTEYRRYSDSPNSAASTPSAASSGAGAGAATSARGGLWNIHLHAYGDAENLRVDLTSDPALPQDDIFLLLTVGLTRAELDQARSASVGESVALEALGTLTGADRAVKDALPLIDEFRFGSAYSSRTGRTEPTVTVGKRLTDRVRANVTSGLSESREIRSNLEWRLSPRVSVEGSYDNVNDIGSATFGNLGADVRWRLEFE